MKILIIGLGLIGGSMARALKYNTEHYVAGYDIRRDAVRKALLVGAIDEIVENLDSLDGYDVIILASYPSVTLDFFKEKASLVKRGTYVYDLGGIKRQVCEVGFAAAEKYGFCFVGGHPMAGIQYSGFEASRESLFHGATMLLVPHRDIDVRQLDFTVKLFKACGFTSVKITDAENHDRIIAYTSQLAHVLSNAYVKSPTAPEFKGYSAGSFRDLTRVAHLNAKMWAELFMDNRDNLIREVECLAHSLLEYSDAMKAGDTARLEQLLEDGCKINDEIKADEKK